MRKLVVVSILCILGAAIIGGCSPRVIEKVLVQTDTLKVSDTVIIHARPDTVKVEIPVSSQETVTKDTASHLEDNLYVSDASWDGMFLHHSLKSKPGAALQKEVIVHDTIKIKEKEESHNKESKEKKTIYVQPTWKDYIKSWGFGFLCGVLICILYGARKKIIGLVKKLG